MCARALRYILSSLVLQAVIVFPASAARDGVSYVKLVPVHATLMALGFLCFLAAAVFPAFRRGRPGWLRHHQILAMGGTILSLSAFAVAYLMVGLSGRPQFGLPHTYLGAIVIVLIVVTLFLGLFRMRLKPYTLQAISAHRWLGMIIILLMALAVISGLITAGFLR